MAKKKGSFSDLVKGVLEQTKGKEKASSGKVSDKAKSVAKKASNIFGDSEKAKQLPDTTKSPEHLNTATENKKESAAEKLNKIFNVMSENRKEELKHKKDLIKKKAEQIREDEGYHKEILAALGSKPSRRKKKGDKGKDGESEEEEKKSRESSIGQTIGGAIGVMGVTTMVGAKKAGVIGSSPTPKSTGSSEKPRETPNKKEQAAPAPTASKETKESISSAPVTITGGDKGVMEMIQRHEGVRYEPYKDTKGLWTVGVGHLIGDGKSLPASMNRKFSPDEVNQMFAQDFDHHRKAAEKIPGYEKLNKTGQGALIDLTFNMGPVWYKKWPNFTKSIQAGDVQGAAQNLEQSAWYKQVGKRAPEVVAMIRSGAQGMPEAQPSAIGKPAAAPSPVTVAASTRATQAPAPVPSPVTVAASTGATQAPAPVPSAIVVPSAPKSASVPARSAENKELKDSIRSEQPTVVLNNRSLEKTTTNTKSTTQMVVNDDPIYLRKVFHG